MYGNISRYQKINLLKIWFFCVLILRKYLARYFQSLLNSWFFNDFRQEQCKQNTLFSFVNFVTWDYMTLCSYHVKYAFQSESTLYSCLNVKEFLARNARNSLLESSRNSLLTTQLNHLPSLVKKLSIRLWTKWLSVPIQLQFLEIIWAYIITALLKAKL